MILNLGSAPGFQQIEAGLVFPAKMRVDYVRVYQHPDSINYGCDPKDFPTMEYIAKYVLHLPVHRDDTEVCPIAIPTRIKTRM